MDKVIWTYANKDWFECPDLWFYNKRTSESI